MDDLLNHLLVPKDGQLVPASSLPSSSPSPNIELLSQAPQVILGSTYASTNRSAVAAEYTKRSSDGTTTLGTSKKRKMDVMDLEPPPSAHRAGNTGPSPFTNLSGDSMIHGPNLQTVEDFDRDNPWEPKPKPSMMPVPASKPNPLPKIALHDLCQRLGLSIDKDVRETAPQSFAGSIRVGDTVFVELKGPFRSKKEAREALSAAALPLVQGIQVDAQQRKDQAIAARKASSEHLRSENWVGMLQNHVQATVRGYAIPEYQDYRADDGSPQFACTVTFPGSPLTPFGSATELYPSKAEAKKAAAREAILWLRSQGAYIASASSVPTAGAKKRKMSGSPAQDVESDQRSTGLTQALHTVDVNAVVSLGFTQPMWETKQSQPASGRPARDQNLAGFVDMACVFIAKDVAQEPRLAGRIGEVKNVYSRKKAKDMCCLEVLRLLEEIKQSR